MRCAKTGKIAYRTLEIALMVKGKLKRRGIVLSCYRCGKHWHLGNTAGTRLENTNRLFDRIKRLDRERAAKPLNQGNGQGR